MLHVSEINMLPSLNYNTKLKWIADSLILQCWCLKTTQFTIHRSVQCFFTPEQWIALF